MSDSIFTKIKNKEIPGTIVYEDDQCFAIEDINPQAPIHILVIPKKPFCSFDDFSQNADDKTISSLVRSISKITRKLKIEEGYRLITNIGYTGGQEVPHLHIHLLSGEKFGKIIP